MPKKQRRANQQGFSDDEAEAAEALREERLHIDEEPAGTDDSGYDGVDVLRKGPLEEDDATNSGNTRIGLSGTGTARDAAIGKNNCGNNAKNKKANSDPLGYYKVMGVSPTADAAAIRKAFLSLSQSYHSDKHSQQDETAQGYMNERFQQLTEAYEVLSDPRRRAAYDHSGALGIARLELVPLSAVNPADVNKYLSLLRAEAQLKRAERLVSASSSATIHISAAHHFSSLRALGLMNGVDDDDDDDDDENESAAVASSRPKGPNIGAFSTAGKPQQQQQQETAPAEVTSSSSGSDNALSSSSSSSGEADEDTSSSSSSSSSTHSPSVPDELTEEERAFFAQQLAYEQHMRREAAEKARLLAALESAPPRWDPSHRGMGVEHYQQRHAPSSSSPSSSASSSPQEGAEAAESTTEEETKASAGHERAAADQQKEDQKSKKERQREEEAPAKADEKENEANKPQQQPPQQQQQQQQAAQLAEVLINGRPTLVAILPAAVAAQVRSQMGGKIAQHTDTDQHLAGGVASEAGSSSSSPSAVGEGVTAGSEGGSSTAPANMTRKERKAYEKGIMRKAATAKAMQTLREMPLMVLLSLDFVHMYNYPIGDRTNITFRAAAKKNMESNGGSDGANVGISLEHVLSPLSKIRLNLKATFGLLKLQFSHTRVLSAASTLTNKATLYAGGYFLRDFSMSLTRRLSAALSLTNTLTLSAGRAGGSFSSAAQYIIDSGSMVAASTDIGFGSLGVSASYVARLTKRLKATISLRSSLLGGSSECSYEIWYARNPLEQIGLGAAVAIPYSYNIFTGVTSSEQPTRLTQLFVLLARGDHSIRIPIVVVVNDHVAKLLLLGSVPALAASAARLAARPFAALRRARQYQRERSLHFGAVAAARRRAQVEMLALHSVVAKRRAVEEAVSGGGLVILKATYGVLHPTVAVLPPLPAIVASASPLPASAADATPTSSAFAEIGVAADVGTDAFNLTTDVTGALQSLVHGSALVLAEGTKEALPGFFDVDPATKERRHISVSYLFKKQLHFVEVDAEEALTLPMEEHIAAASAGRQ